MPLSSDVWRYTVLFYVSLLLTSILLTLIILGLKNLIMFVFRKAVQGGREGVKSRSAAKSYVRASGYKVKAAPLARGERIYASPRAPVKTHPASPYSATPWGWPGREQEASRSRPRPSTTNRGTLNAYLARNYEDRAPEADWKRNIGRPIRDDWSSLSGEAYKPSKDAMSRYEMSK